jgi:hypothetical protein
LKIIHCLSIAILAFGFVTVAEILGSAITGKQENSGTR